MWSDDDAKRSFMMQTNLNLKDEPRVKSTGLGLGLGSSKRRKKAWYSTQIFQKTLQQSLLPIRNSRVPWGELWGTRRNVTHTTRHWWVFVHHTLQFTYIWIWPQLDEETFPFEAQFTHFWPVEGVDLWMPLEGWKKTFTSVPCRQVVTPTILNTPRVDLRTRVTHLKDQDTGVPHGQA